MSVSRSTCKQFPVKLKHPNEVKTGISWQGDLIGPIWLFIKLSSVSYLSFHLVCKENSNTAGQKKSRELFLSVFSLLLLQPSWRWIALTRRGCTVVRKCWSLLLSQTCATDQAFNDILHQTLPSHPSCHLNVCTTLDCKLSMTAFHKSDQLFTKVNSWWTPS